MFLTRFRPNTLDSLLGDFFPAYKGDGEGQTRERFRLPVTNVNETDKEFVLTMEMPGVEKKDIDVVTENDQITIMGEKTEKIQTEGLLRREIRSDKFRRSFLLDSNIDGENIKAKLEKGVLIVTIPKKKENVGRKIAVD
jgi:HSP20 family protein